LRRGEVNLNFCGKEKAVDEQPALLLKRFSGNPDVEKARAEFARAQGIEHLFAAQI
jgi:hypothetical protein